MNITLDRDPFLAAMQRVIGAVDRKTTIPVLQHIALKLDGDTLRLTATNLDMQATTTCPADGDDAHFTLPGQTVLDILSNWPAGGQVVISTDKDDPRISMKCGRSRFRLPTLKPDDMPIMAAPEGDSVTLPASELARALDGVAYAHSRDATRYYLCGVFVHMDGDALKLVGTDGKRLALDIAAVAGQTGSAILAAAFVTEAARVLDGGECELTVAPGRSMLRVGDTELISKTIDGNYPEYQRVIPTDHPHRLTVARDGLISAVRRAQIVSGDKDRSVRLVLSSSALGVVAKNMDSGEGDDEIDATWTGEDMRIGFSAALLTDALAKFAGDEVTFEVGDKQAAVVIREGDRLAVLMPHRG